MKSFSRSHNWQMIKMSILTHLPAKLLRLCPTLCDPMDCSLGGSSVPGSLQARISGVGCHALLQAIFPTQGLNLCPPVLTGGFFTTGTTWDLIPNTMPFELSSVSSHLNLEYKYLDHGMFSIKKTYL